MDAIEYRLEVAPQGCTPALGERHRRYLATSDRALDHLRRRFPIRALLGGERVQILAQSSTIISGAELAAHITKLCHVWLARTARRLARWMLHLVNGQLNDVVVHPNLDLTIMLGHTRRGSIQLESQKW